MKLRIVMMAVFGVLDLLVYWFFVKSYQLAHFAHLNQGILMSIFSLLPILMSISFFFFFHQHLKKIEIVGILLSVGGVLVISFSKDSP
jgi:drug/metabolite transporter (DMT)-like permease